MDETAALLRTVFQTRNPATFALPATGGSGMEASLINLLESALRRQDYRPPRSGTEAVELVYSGALATA